MTAQIQIRYLDPEQDAAALQTIAREAARIMVPGEEILCIAAENRTSVRPRLRPVPPRLVIPPADTRR